MGKGAQLGLAEAFASQKLGVNRRLERIAAEVKWYRFEKLLKRLEPEGAGRPPYAPLLMFKAMLLSQLYTLSDEQLEEQLNDKVSFRRFLGLGLEDDAPDHTTLCRFRNRLAGAGLTGKLFAEFNKQISERRLVLRQGTMIDATLVTAAGKPPADDNFAEASDPDARFARIEGKGTTYGYKAHLGVDQGTRLIRTALLTPANVNETVVADRLVCQDQKAVYADKAYSKRERREALRARGIKPRIMHKSWGGGPPLSSWQKLHNRLIAPIRAEVETVFATLKRRFGYRLVRYRGLAKNQAQLFLLALAYNMRRVADMLLRPRPESVSA
jgi:transposase, IS5 family